MMRFVKQVAPVLSLAVLGAATVSEAGNTIDFASCYKAADGSGYCHGTMRGFRNHVNTNTYLYFYEDSSGGKSMAARFPITSSTGTVTVAPFGCVPTTTALIAMWPRAMQHRGYVEIYWDLNGACTSLYLINGSNYSDF